MEPVNDDRVRRARLELVQTHMASEDDHRFTDTLETFEHHRYEVVPTGEVFEGPEALLAFYRETHQAFPDFHFENSRMRHLDDAVLVETEFVGTHLGPWRGLPATGTKVRYRMCNIFEFDGVNLVCERLYFDLMTVLEQVGIARDPTSPTGRFLTLLNHPIVVIRAFVRSAWRRADR